jgi:hypothetical protein
MLLFLPFAAFLIFFLVLRDRGLDWRRSSLASAIFCATCVVAITEIASTMNMVTRFAVAIFWSVTCLAALAYYGVSKPRLSPPPHPPHRKHEPLDRTTRLLLAGTAIVVLLIGITAVIAAPDTWDALEYHLPRTIMWMSNHNVRFFPTPDYCQLIYGPWSEFAMMHTELLWGTDRFVNIVEWFSLLGSLIAVSLTAEKLGAGPRGQVLAAVACATIPEGILEASGPMNTFVVSFWIAITVFFLMDWNDQPSWFNTICVGLAAGLAISTKGTAYILLPFLVLACWLMGSARIRILFLKRSAALLLLIFALNAPQYLRSYEFSGSPLGLPLPVKYPRTEFVMPHVTVRGTAANMLRNISVHLCTPSRSLNARTENLIRLGIRLLGVNPDDPSQTWIGLPFHMNHFSSNEIIAGNPLHLTLLLVCAGLLLWRPKEGVRRRWALLYTAGILASFALFCALLRWQMWSSRYHLPLFVLGSALIGLAVERYFPRQIANTIAAILLFFGVFFALTNRSRSLIPWGRVDDVYHSRAELYFTNEHESIAPAHIAAANFVNHLDCRYIGIDSYVADPEIKDSPDSFFVYPLLALIRADGRTRSAWYSGVHNLSSRYQKQQVHPTTCAIMCLDCVNHPEKWSEYGGISSPSVFGNVMVFGSASEAPHASALNPSAIHQ